MFFTVINVTIVTFIGVTAKIVAISVTVSTVSVAPVTLLQHLLL
jgi:hypothetical protein